MKTDIESECLTPKIFDLYQFSYTHKGHVFSGHIGAASWSDAVEKLASVRNNARITGETIEFMKGEIDE